MLDLLRGPWPWFISGPLLGLMVPLLLFTGNKQFGVSSSLRHICTAIFPLKADYFKYKWKDYLWSLVLVAGTIVGAFFAVVFLDGDSAPAVSEAAKSMFAQWGLKEIDGILPAEIFSVQNLLSLPTLLMLGVGGFFIGFGTRYGNGCTSGHAIMGLSLLNPGSLAAVISFFAGGIIVSNFIIPLLLRL
ncbi:MAG: YeeE/YedE family protein [Spirochaetales bacterium]|nr:YeeE/YedE family protein [Spirochaetales bacterium]